VAVLVEKMHINPRNYVPVSSEGCHSSEKPMMEILGLLI